MLGFPEHNEPIKEPFASQIREALRRRATGEYNEEELKQMERSKEILSKFEAIWV